MLLSVFNVILAMYGDLTTPWSHLGIFFQRGWPMISGQVLKFLELFLKRKSSENDILECFEFYFHHIWRF